MFCCGCNTFLHRERKCPNGSSLQHQPGSPQTVRSKPQSYLGSQTLSSVWLQDQRTEFSRFRQIKFLHFFKVTILILCNVDKEEFCAYWRLILIKSSWDLILAIRYRDTEIQAVAARAGLEINKLIYVLWRHSIIISNLKLRKLMHWRLKETLISFKFILWFKFPSSIWTCRISCIPN